jgi:YbbR domain-containing protein
MVFQAIRWLKKNAGTFILAFILAVVVWVSAIVASDPNIDKEYPQNIPLEIFGQDSGLILVEKVPAQVRVSIRAPRSVWSHLENDPGMIRAWIDLSGLGVGQYLLPVKTQISLSPNQVLGVEPNEIKVSLEPLKMMNFAVQIMTIGEPTLGYRKGSVRSDPPQVTVSGPASLVSKVAKVQATLDISGISETVKKEMTLQAIGQDGVPVTGISITPQIVTVTQDIVLLGGYRNVVVKVITRGQVADGYWLTNINVNPPNVTVFSTNPQLVNALPGYVETSPVDLTDLNDDVDIRTDLNLPKGVELAGEESVLVRLSIAALEGSLSIALPLEVVGLSPEYSAMVSPEQVDVLITGPLPILNNLKPGGIRVSVDLSGLSLGVHQVTPVVDLLPNQVKVASILPENVEVTIVRAATLPITASPTAVFPSITATP